MNKKSIILISLLILILLGIGTTTFAYLSKTGSNNATVVIGDVDYTTIGKDVVIENMLPSYEVLPNTHIPFATFTSASNVDTNIRVKMNIKCLDENNAVVDMINTLGYQNIIGFDDTSVIKIVSDGWHLDSNDIVINNDNTVDTTFYYFANELEEQVVPAGNMEVPFLTSLIFNGEIVGPELSGKSIVIEIVFEARQADYISWEELASVNFTTGIN